MKKKLDDPFAGFIGHLSETTSLDGIKPSMEEEKASVFTPKEQQTLQSFGNGGVTGATSNVAMQITRKMATTMATPTLKVVNESAAQLSAAFAGMTAEHCQNNSDKENTLPQQYDPNASVLAVFSGVVTTALQITAGRRGVNPFGQVALSTFVSGLLKVMERSMQSQAEEKPTDISQESTQDTLEPAQRTLGQKAVIVSATSTFRVTAAATRVLLSNSNPYATAAFIAGSGVSGGARHVAINQKDSDSKEVKPEVSHTGRKR